MNAKKELPIDEMIGERIRDEVYEQMGSAREDLSAGVISTVLEQLKVYRPIEVRHGEKVTVDSSINHEMTEEILHYVSARVPVLMVGPAGSGKTHIASKCATLLSLPHYSISVNEQSSKSDFLGYYDANGQVVKTNFRKAYEQGGVFIIDEIDAGNPNILTVINSALSNELCPFPDAMIQRHEDFVCICTANTFGEGESFQYIGRNILDASTRDRFASVLIDYSDNLEKNLIPNFFILVRELRKHLKENNTLHVISTRSGIRAEMLKSAKGELGMKDLISIFNLHQIVSKDVKVRDLLMSYVQ